MVGEIVKVNCPDNPTLHGKVGQVVLDDEKSGFVFGTCVLIDGAVYGFDREEITRLNQKNRK
jgi:hypothetical protein